MRRLVMIKKSHNKDKKLDAVFDNDGRLKTISFGASGYTDYTKTKDKIIRDRYLKRHSKMGEDWNDPETRGALSRHILWGESTSLNENIRKFKSRFKL